MEEAVGYAALWKLERAPLSEDHLGLYALTLHGFLRAPSVCVYLLGKDRRLIRRAVYSGSRQTDPAVICARLAEMIEQERASSLAVSAEGLSEFTLSRIHLFCETKGLLILETVLVDETGYTLLNRSAGRDSL